MQTWVLFLSSFLLLLWPSLPANAQEGLLAIGGEDAPAEIADPTELVRAALEDLVASDSLNPEDATTVGDPDLLLSALGHMLEPMTLDDLMVEIVAWRNILQERVAEVADVELELLALDPDHSQSAGSDQTAGADTSAQSDTATDPELDEQKRAKIDELTEKREARTVIVDRLRLVLDRFEGKGGDPADVREYRDYASAVSGITVQVNDAETAYLTLTQWVISEEGGIRIARQVGSVLMAVLVAAIIGWIASLAVNIGLKRTDLSSTLLRHFLRNWILRIAILMGVLVGLAGAGMNMTPILAGLGAAGLVLAFALQNTIGNFASGLLILFQRPFDQGDEIEAAGVTGTVEKVSLFSTHMSTAENRKLIVPNNMIWEDVIVNSTGAPTRRLSIEVELDKSHSLDESEAKLMAIMNAHPDVLKAPPPEVKLSAMTADSLTFTCWPWVATQRKDAARWDLVSKFGHELNMLKGTAKSGNA